MRVFVIDDSDFYREVVAEAAVTVAHATVIGTAAGCDEALRKLGGQPADVVFCDVCMPGKDGIETLGEIRERYPDTLVIMISSVNTRSTESTVRALEMGAFEFVRKPEGGSREANIATLTQNISSIIRLAAIKLNTQRVLRTVSAMHGSEPRGIVTKEPKGAWSVLVIAASTGGPEALGRLFRTLPADLGVPVLVVQHMPAPFPKALARSLDRKSALHVCQAEDGELVVADTAYIAPGGRHMSVQRSGQQFFIRLLDTAPVHGCRPSADVLFDSVAEAYESRGVVAAILTGMGEDGCSGVRTLKAGKCYCVVQSEQSCVVCGMPRAVLRCGLADAEVVIDEMGPALCRFFGHACQETV